MRTLDTAISEMRRVRRRTGVVGVAGPDPVALLPAGDADTLAPGGMPVPVPVLDVPALAAAFATALASSAACAATAAACVRAFLRAVRSSSSSSSTSSSSSSSSLSSSSSSPSESVRSGTTRSILSRERD